MTPSHPPLARARVPSKPNNWLGSTAGLHGLVIAALALAAIVHGFWVRGLTEQSWFHYDYWSNVENGVFDWNDLTRDHGGHWALPSALTATGLRYLVGFEYWPAWGLIHIISWGGIACWTGHVLHKRGVTAPLSVAGGIMVLTVGTAPIFKPWLLNQPIGHISWTGASLIMQGTPTRRRRVVLAGVLTAGIVASSLVVFFTISALIVSTLRKSDRRWIPALIPPLAIYGLWRVVFLDATRAGNPVAWSLELVASLPWLMFHVVERAITNYLDAGRFVSVVIVLSIIGAIIWRFFAQRLDGYEARTTIMLTIWALSVVVSRALNGTGLASAPRYSFNLVILVVLGLGGLLAHRSTRSSLAVGTVALIALVTLVVPGQLDSQSERFRGEAALSAQTRADVETAAALIADGLHYQPNEYVRFQTQGAGILTYGQLATLVDGGYRPSPHPNRIDTVAARMLFDIEEAPAYWGAWCDNPSSNALNLGPGSTTVLASRDRISLSLRWNADDGRVRTTEVSIRAGEPRAITIPDSVMSGSVELIPTGLVCVVMAST